MEILYFHFHYSFSFFEFNISHAVKIIQLQVRHNEVMEVGARISVPVSAAESKISKRFDVIPSGTLYPNADEIDYLRRIVKYKAC